MIEADPKLLERRRNRANKIRGDQAEAIVAHRLRALGFQAIVKLETGWRLVRKAGKIVGAKPLAKVSGDFRAVAPGGKSVLVEVKRRAEVLRQSDFQPHSRRALDDHAAAGGLSLIAWVSPSHGIAIFDWTAFRHAVSIPWALTEAMGIPGQAARIIPFRRPATAPAAPAP